MTDADLFDTIHHGGGCADVLTVSALTAVIKSLLEDTIGTVTVAGEVSNLRRPPSGHLYFTLKDPSSQIAGVMFRSDAQHSKVELAEGLEVVCTGRVSVYPPRGNYQIIVRRVEIRGAGALEAAFRKLVEKLTKEGLFDEERKRPVPLVPRRIGIITSPSSAAVIDILRVFARRFPNVWATVFPTSVQGKPAKDEIVDAIERANAFEDIEVLILARGGGSLEDLWSFNEEVVARAVAASRIPVVTGIGHEVDVTIAGLAADHRAATPTAAAEAAMAPESDLRDQLSALRDRLARSLAGQLDYAGTHLAGLARSVRPEVLQRQLESHFQRTDDLFAIASGGLRAQQELSGEHLEGIFAQLRSLDPLAVLARGYSVTTDLATGEILRDVKSVQPGQGILTRLAQGEMESDVTRARKMKGSATDGQEEDL